jgi:hypothetical protein
LHRDGQVSASRVRRRRSKRCERIIEAIEGRVDLAGVDVQAGTEAQRPRPRGEGRQAALPERASQPVPVVAAGSAPVASR